MQTFEVEQTPCFYVTEQAELEKMVEQLANEPLLAVDTEFLRTNTFYPIVGLIQIATHEICFLVDPISCNDLQPLKSILLDSEKRIVMHACSEDLEVLHRIFGALPATVFDTQIAASMVSRDHQLGLQKLILSYCDKEIPKDQTRSDWTKRPLTENQKVYAALDVVCLLQVYDALAEKLDDLERMTWCEEECRRTVEGYMREPDSSTYYRSMGDAWKLSGRNLQVLQALAQWREELARSKNKPKGFIFSDREIFSIAERMPRSLAQLSSVGDFKPVQIRRYGAEAVAVIEEAISSEALELPLVKKPFSNRVKKITKAIKPEIEKVAVELDMATDRLANRRNLEKFVKAVVEGMETPGYFQGWRAEVLVPTLNGALQEIDKESAS